MSTIATLTEGQTFVVTQPGHKFEGRTLTVKSLGTTGMSALTYTPGSSGSSGSFGGGGGFSGGGVGGGSFGGR